MERHVFFYVWKELKLYHQRVITNLLAATIIKHLKILVDYIKFTYTPIKQHLTKLLTRQEITYSLL